jgi:hypothetical protein
MYKGHYFGVPRVAVVDRFDCTVKLFCETKMFLNLKYISCLKTDKMQYSRCRLKG